MELEAHPFNLLLIHQHSLYHDIFTVIHLQANRVCARIVATSHFTNLEANSPRLPYLVKSAIIFNLLSLNTDLSLKANVHPENSHTWR